MTKARTQSVFNLYLSRLKAQGQKEKAERSALLVIANDSKKAKEIAELNDYSSGKVTNAKDIYHCAGSSSQQQTLFDLIEAREWEIGSQKITYTPEELEDYDILSDSEITIDFIISRADPDVGLMEDYISHVRVNFDIWEVELI